MESAQGVDFDECDLPTAATCCMQETIMITDDVLSSRFITGQPGMFYQVNES